MSRSAGTALGVVLALLALPGSAIAAAIPVTTTADAIGGAGCSLREAISAANNNNTGPGADCATGVVGADTINLGAGAYVLDEANASPAGENANLTGDLDILESVTIDGASAALTSIDANSIDRVMHLFNVSTVVQLRDLEITGGAAPSGGVGAGGGTQPANSPSIGGIGGQGSGGGGVLVQSATLMLESVEVNDNFAGSGGAGGNAGAAGNGTAGNPGAIAIGGQGGTGGVGGGVSLLDGELHATDTVFDGNFAGNGGNGGGGGSGGTGGTGASGFAGGASVGGQGGFAGDGGAIAAASAELELTRVTIADNEAGVSGAAGAAGTPGTGGVGTSSAGGNGGAASGGGSVFGGFGGAISAADTSATITESQLVGNKAGRAGDAGASGPAGAGGAGNTGPGAAGNSFGGSGGGGGSYGAITLDDGSLSIIESTVSGNSASAGGDGGASGTGSQSYGGNGGTGGATGGISKGGSGGVLTLTNSTLSGNQAGPGGDGGASGAAPVSFGGSGGNGGGEAGLIVFNPTSGTLNHVTIAANQAGAGGAAGLGPGTPGGPGNAGSGGGLSSSTTMSLIVRNTLISGNTANQCSGSGFTDGGSNLSFPLDISCPATLHSDPLLGPLASNGGSTQTMLLGVGSPAIDAVAANCASTDQREVARPKGTACDIGALEVSPPSAVTGAFSAVTPTGATLAGTVHPGQVPTTYRFQYGTTTAYGLQTAATPAGSGGATVAAAATLTGLAPSTTYNYRVVATSPDGTATGANDTFTTAPAPVNPGPGLAAFGGVSILTRSARADRKGRVSVKLRCPAAAVVRCKGKLSLTAKVKVKRKGKKPKTKTIKLGSARFDIAAGKTKTVRLKLSKSKRRLLARSKRLKGALSASSTDNRGGKAKIKKGKLGLKAPKRKRR